MTLDQVDTFLAIDGKGAVTLYAGKVDLGTGVRTALAQIVAEELDVPLASVTLVMGDTALTPDQGPTYGSQSIQTGGMQIRQAAATARSALLGQAAQRLGVKLDDLAVTDGTVGVKAGGASITYADLIGGRSLTLKVDAAVQTKAPADFKIVGKSIARADVPEKLTGRFTYMHDLRVPGIAAWKRDQPARDGCNAGKRRRGLDQGYSGIVKVVRDGNFLGVVTQTEWAEVRAARQLKTAWSKSETLPDEKKLWEHVRATKVVKDDVTSNVGDVAATMAGEGKTLSATYDFTIHTHGSIGPSCAISEFQDGKLTSWSASQATHSLRKQLAKIRPSSRGRALHLCGRGRLLWP